MTKKQKIGGWFGAIAAAVLAGLVATKPTPTPAPVEPSDATLAGYAKVCSALYREELQREIDPSGRQSCVQAAIDGGTADTLRATIRASDEYRALHAPKPKPVAAAFPFPAEQGTLRIEGQYFRDAAGNVWSWRGATQFLLFARFLRGEDITPQLTWARSVGVNVIRVFGNVPWAGWEDYKRPDLRPDYREKLGQFFDRVAAAGLRVEFVPLTYADTVSTQRQIVQAAYDVAAGRWGVLIETANEPHVNSIDPVEVMRGVNRRGVLSAYGIYEPVPPADYNGVCDPNDPRFQPDARSSLPVLDYVTAHTPRDAEWPRKAKDLLEYRTGGVGCPRIDGLRRPIVGDEPMGGGEPGDVMRKPDGRSDVVWDFQSHFGVCALFAAGCTYHSQRGLEGLAPLPGSVQQRIAEAILAVWKAVPADAQTCGYTRSGAVDYPIGWREGDALRGYGVICGHRAFVVAVRPQTTRDPVNGWRLVSSAAGVLELAR